MKKAKNDPSLGNTVNKRKFALMTTNCTSAIHLGLAAKKIQVNMKKI